MSKAPPKPKKTLKAEQNPGLKRAHDLWRASGGTANSRQIAKQCCDEGYTVTSNNVRAWKSRHRWRMPRSAAAVRREIAKGDHVRGAQAEAPKNPAAVAAAIEDAVDDLAESIEATPTASSIEIAEVTQRQLHRMIGTCSRKFQQVLRRSDLIMTSEDVLNIARAASMMGDTIGRLGEVIADARRTVPSRVGDLASFLKKGDDAEIIETRRIVDVTPEPEKKLSGVLQAFRAS